MKKFQVKAIRTYFKVVSAMSSQLGGASAFRLFQKVRNKQIRSMEKKFFAEAQSFSVPFPNENIQAYRLGNSSGKVVFLVHGWDSNAGSLSRIAFELVKNGYQVYSFNLPAHGFAKKKCTNLLECKEAVKAVINYIDPSVPFDIVAHSFGSAAAIYALSEIPQKINRMVLLTSPNAIIDFFLQFKKGVGLSHEAFGVMINKANALLKEDVANLKIADKLQKVLFASSLIIHDKRDKVLDYAYAEQIANSSELVQLKMYENIGHYRMLWRDDVVKDTIEFINLN